MRPPRGVLGIKSSRSGPRTAISIQKARFEPKAIDSAGRRNSVLETMRSRAFDFKGSSSHMTVEREGIA